MVLTRFHRNLYKLHKNRADRCMSSQNNNENSVDIANHIKRNLVRSADYQLLKPLEETENMVNVEGDYPVNQTPADCYECSLVDTWSTVNGALNQKRLS